MAEKFTLYLWILGLVLAVFAAEAEPRDSRRGSIPSNTKIRSIENFSGIEEARQWHDQAFDVGFSITNSTGHELYGTLAIFYHQDTAGSRLSKRDVSRPIRACPRDRDFVLSWCNRLQSVRQWSVMCRSQDRDPRARSVYRGECGQHEICMDGRSVASHGSHGPLSNHASTAYCVSQQNFVSIATLLDNGKATGASVQSAFHPAEKQQYSVGAVLARQGSETPLEVQSLEIQAQTSDLIGNVETWRTLNAGDSQCSNCASLGLLEVPEGTRRIKTHVE
ncbi:MAG: hypothetical protein Q9212_007502, partial [Teloschistes hypoglaucus]